MPEDITPNNSGKRFVLAGVEQLPDPASGLVALLSGLGILMLAVRVLNITQQPEDDVSRRALARSGLLSFTNWQAFQYLRLATSTRPV